jgi:hypothetical protein
MAFTEALRLVIDADTRGAVQGLEKLGATADRELSKSEQRLDKWGNRLTTLGTGMMAFGAAAVVGLGALARESEEANLSQVKLQNTIDNMPKLAGATASEFTDLANSIQDVTAADADQIVAAEAMLGTFNLTAREIKSITPLVVDYARKFGVDMVSAATQVGKALDGNSNALKRNGVSIDEALFATDRYAAVQKALSDQVGGFAEAEGKTFAGSLQRMKNELGDLAEGVGGGAVDAFTTMFGAVERVAGALEGISPGAQNAIGKIATFGAVGLIAAGGISTLIGQVITARKNFADAASAVQGMTTKLGGLKTVAGIGGAATALAAVLITIKQLTEAAERAKFEDFIDSLNSGSNAARAFAETGVRANIALGDLDEGFEKVLDTSAAAGVQYIKTAEALGVSSEELDRLRKRLDEKKQADIGGAAAQDEYNSEVQAGAEAMDDQASSTDDATTALKDYADALSRQFDPLFGMISALQGTQDAQLKAAEAQAALNEAMAGGNADEIAEAQRNYDRALSDAQGSIFDVQQAQITLNDAIRLGHVDLDEAQRQMFDWAIQAGFTGDQALIMAGQLGDAASAAHNLGAEDPVVSVTTTGVTAVTADLANIKAKADAIPRSINVDIISTFKEFFGGSTRQRQHGGPVRAGEAYIVGEKRPELFVPNENGMIWPALPNAVSGGTGGGGGMIEVHSHVYLDGREVAESVRKVIQMDHGGNVQNALGYSRS